MKVRVTYMYNGRKFTEIVTMEEKIAMMCNPQVTIFNVEFI